MNVVSRFELWIKGCEINGTKIYPVEGSGSTALYECWNEYLCKHRFWNTTPIYIGWVAGKEICATANYLGALACWRSCREEASRTGGDT